MTDIVYRYTTHKHTLVCVNFIKYRKIEFNIILVSKMEYRQTIRARIISIDPTLFVSLFTLRNT